MQIAECVTSYFILTLTVHSTGTSRTVFLPVSSSLDKLSHPLFNLLPPAVQTLVVLF